jgi:dihydrofolate reductase
MIVAAATNNVIGRDGGMPWHLSADLKRFKAITMGKPIVMGRLTFESIGKPLPGRRNIVISRQSGFVAEGCEVVASPTAALAAAADAPEIMVIGGGRIYQQLLPLADRVYLTRVHASPEGDAYFPDLPASEWRLIEREDFPVSNERPTGYSFELYQRIAR